MKSQTPKNSKAINEDFNKKARPANNVTSMEDRKASQDDKHWPSNLEGQEREEEESEDVGQTRQYAKKAETNVEQRTARNA